MEFMRKNMITYLSELAVKRSEQENVKINKNLSFKFKKIILNILINKFAEKDKKLISHLNCSLGNIIFVLFILLLIS